MKALTVAWLASGSLLLARCVGPTPAYPHDIYKQLRQKEQGTVGQLCCGGDPNTGDCEAIKEYTVHADGSATFIVNRKGRREVRIGKDKIQWMPVPGSDAEAHWCGETRAIVSNAPINEENPDTRTWTYCAFIAPGGV